MTAALNIRTEIRFTQQRSGLGPVVLNRIVGISPIRRYAISANYRQRK
jgi:hypothetical protein